MYLGPRYCFPGDRVPQSGAYLVLHHEHRPNHAVTVIKGELFPHCRVCRDRVRFKLKIEAEYLMNDADFSQSALPKAA